MFQIPLVDLNVITYHILISLAITLFLRKLVTPLELYMKGINSHKLTTMHQISFRQFYC